MNVAALKSGGFFVCLFVLKLFRLCHVWFECVVRKDCWRSEWKEQKHWPI